MEHVRDGPAIKRMKLDSSCSEGTVESVYSLQGKETDYVKDTSDTDWSSENDLQEYEVAELSDPDNPLMQDEISSSEEAEVDGIAELGAVVAAVIYDSEIDLGLNADISTECATLPTSGSDDDVDPQLNKADFCDFSCCVQCKRFNPDSLYRYCYQCYRAKKSLFPPRPKHTRRKKSKKLKRVKECQVIDEGDAVDGPSSSQATCSSSQDSGFSSVGEFKVDDWAKPSTSYMKTEPNTMKQELNDLTDDSPEDTLCRLCFVKPIRSIFVHGKEGCINSCYSCALKAWARCGCCPFCKAKVSQVLRIRNNVKISIA